MDSPLLVLWIGTGFSNHHQPVAPGSTTSPSGNSPGMASSGSMSARRVTASMQFGAQQ